MTAKEGATTILENWGLKLKTGARVFHRSICLLATNTPHPNLHHPYKYTSLLAYLEKDGVGMVASVGKELPQQSFEPLPPLKLGIRADPASLASTVTM